MSRIMNPIVTSFSNVSVSHISPWGRPEWFMLISLISCISLGQEQKRRPPIGPMGLGNCIPVLVYHSMMYINPQVYLYTSWEYLTREQL